MKNHALIGSFLGGHGIAGGAFSHDGTNLATAGEADRVVRLWDVASRRMIHEFKGHTKGVMAAVFSADDQMVISAGDDNTIRFWELGARTSREIHLGHTSRIWNLALSPDGQTIASASHDGTVRLWELEAPGDYVKLPVVATSEELLTLEGFAGPVQSCRFSPDGKTLATLSSGAPGKHAEIFLWRTALDEPEEAAPPR